MVQIVKRHKVTGEIVKVDAKKEWVSYIDGKIPAHIFAKIQAATAANTDYTVIAQEGTMESQPYEMTESDKQLKDYCDSRARVVRAMNL